MLGFKLKWQEKVRLCEDYLCDGDPLKDIKDIREIRIVIKDGRIVIKR